MPFYRSWEPLGSIWWVWGAKLTAKLTQKSIIWPLVGKLAEIAKMLENYKFFNSFGSLGLPTSKENWHKSVPRVMKNEAKKWSASWWVFDGFCDQLASILGKFWRPNWTQVNTTWHQNPTTQPIKNIIIFWKAPGTFLNGGLGSLLGGPVGDHE